MSIVLVGRHPVLRAHTALGTQVLTGQRRLIVGAALDASVSTSFGSAVIQSSEQQAIQAGENYLAQAAAAQKGPKASQGAAIAGGICAATGYGAAASPLCSKLGAILGGMLDELDRESRILHGKNFQTFDQARGVDLVLLGSIQKACVTALQGQSLEKRQAFAVGANAFLAKQFGIPSTATSLDWTDPTGGAFSGRWFVQENEPALVVIQPVPAQYGLPAITQADYPMMPWAHDYEHAGKTYSGRDAVGLVSPALDSWLASDASYHTSIHSWDPAKISSNIKRYAQLLPGAIAAGMAGAGLRSSSGASSPKKSAAVPVIVGLGLLALLGALA